MNRWWDNIKDNFREREPMFMEISVELGAE
jgi:hypothetical protein